MSIQPEQLFGKYRVLKRIGVGGMATVYHASQLETGQEVALKVLHEQWSHDETIRKRFEFEASIGSKLKHPAIVPIYEYGIDNERPFIVLKYMEGGNLSHEFAKQRPVKLEVTAKLLTVIGRALDYAHDKGIIHRDLKLENIMLDSKRRPAIGDFGIAKLIGTTRLTLTGQFVGTPHYMAPETLGTTSDQLDKSVDMYAFAVMAYLMATGYFPFTAPDPFQLVLKHKRELPPVPTSIKPDLPPRLNAVLLRGLQKNPIARYFTATEFAEAFTVALEDKGGNTTLIFMDKLNPGQGELVEPPFLPNPTPTFLTAEAKAEIGGLGTAILAEPKDAIGGVDTTIFEDTAAANVITSAAPAVDIVKPKVKPNKRRRMGAVILLTLLCGISFALMQYREALTNTLAVVMNQGMKVIMMEEAQLNKFEFTPTASASENADEAVPTATGQPDEIITDMDETESTSTATRTPSPTRTVRLTNTITPGPTRTSTLRPTHTATTRPTNTPVAPTNTPRPAATNTAILIIPTEIPIVPTSVPVVLTEIPIVPTSVPVVPTDVPIVPTSAPILPIVPTVVQIVPTVVCLLGCG